MNNIKHTLQQVFSIQKERYQTWFVTLFLLLLIVTSNIKTILLVRIQYKLLGYKFFCTYSPVLIYFRDSISSIRILYQIGKMKFTFWANILRSTKILCKNTHRRGESSKNIHLSKFTCLYTFLYLFYPCTLFVTFYFLVVYFINNTINFVLFKFLIFQ